jgi:hypothetical protein
MDASNEQPAARADLPLADDVAEIHREVQVAVNEVKAAKAVLAEKEARLDSVYATVGTISTQAREFIDAYRNPAVADPPPLVPEVPPSVVTVETPAENEGAAPADGAAGTTGK